MNTVRIKRAISAIAYYSGLTKLLSDFNRKNIILGYHHVLPEDDERIEFIQPGMYVTEKTFEMHVRYLTKTYKVVSLHEFLKNDSIQNRCAITFDDGWLDNYEYAFPILRRHNVPATIFISTGVIGTELWPWPDRIFFYMLHASSDEMAAVFMILEKECPDLNLVETFGHRQDDRCTLSESVISFFKGLDSNRLDRVIRKIDDLMHEQGEQLKRHQPWMKWDQIRHMSGNGITFGPHTHNHVILTHAPADVVKSEIRLSRDILSEKLGKPTEMFSYPNGNYNQGIISCLKDLGFRIAVTTRPGTVNSARDLFELKRIMLHDDMSGTIPMLAAKLCQKIPFI